MITDDEQPGDEVDIAPRFVAEEPRYQVHASGERWDLDGVAWRDAPVQPDGHGHVRWSVAWIGLSLICRCPCGAVRYHGSPGGWFIPA